MTKKQSRWILSVFIVPVITAAMFMSSCEKSDDSEVPLPFGTPPEVQVVSEEEFAASGEDIYDDNESIDIIKERWFSLNEPLRIRFKNGRLSVFNAMAHDFEHVEIWMTFPELAGDTLHLVSISKIKSLYEADIALRNETGVYETKSGNPVRIDNIAALDANRCVLKLECDDAIFDMIRNIKMTTTIQMSCHPHGSGNWGKMTPRAARYYAAVDVNLAVMFSSDKFRDSLLAWKGNIKDNAGNEIDRGKLLNSILHKSRLAHGVVTGSGIAGLGGGEAHGCREEYLPNFFYANRTSLDCGWALFVWMHELGHCLGYNHSSSLCYGSFVEDNNAVLRKTYREMITAGELPYTIDPFKTYNNWTPGNNGDSEDMSDNDIE